MQAQQGGQPEFQYGWVMIDNSKTEKAAVRQLELTRVARGFLLCYFHFLQDWERFLISKESGVGKLEKNNIMVQLRELMHCRNEELFKKKVGGHGCKHARGAAICTASSPGPPGCTPRPRMQLADFYSEHRLRRKVVAHMKQDWVPLAEHWACWGAGRQDPAVAAMLCDTNNLSESINRGIKYTDLSRVAQSTIQQLVDTLLTKTVPRFMHQRAHQVVGRASSDQAASAERVRQVVEGLVSSGSVLPQDIPYATGIGRASVGDCIVYLGDMSCTCSYSGEGGQAGGRLRAQILQLGGGGANLPCMLPPTAAPPQRTTCACTSRQRRRCWASPTCCAWAPPPTCWHAAPSSWARAASAHATRWLTCRGSTPSGRQTASAHATTAASTAPAATCWQQRSWLSSATPSCSPESQCCQGRRRRWAVTGGCCMPAVRRREHELRSPHSKPHPPACSASRSMWHAASSSPPSSRWGTTGTLR